MVPMKTVVIFVIFVVGFTAGQSFDEPTTAYDTPPFTTTGAPFTTPSTPFTTTGAPFTTPSTPFTTTGAPFTTPSTPLITTTTGSPSDCVYSDELWADVNPNLYYFCDPLNNRAVQLQCPTGRGFLRNGTLSGCVPFEQWPATCVTQVPTVPSCTGNNVNQPSVATNPNQFYLCLAAGETPVILQCNNGKGFLSNNEALGCVDWAEWRKLKNCNIV